MKKIYTIAFALFSIVCYSQDRESDSLTLVSIYESLDGANWPNYESWLTDLPLDEWEGIRMQNDRVDDLELKFTASANIAGAFPTQVIDLTELTTFEMKHIQVNGPIPESLVQLTKLQRLILENCNLNGDAPQIFNQFPNLKTLTLSFNDLTGPLPALPQGMFLVYIDRNQFSGPIPESWVGNEVSALQLHENNLTGNFDIINTLPNISSINLSDNDWDESTLPLWIDDIPNLDRFSCDNCNLVGEIPSELDFSALTSYSGMFLSDNKLSGDITPLFNNPEHGKNMFMRLRNNELTGELPLDQVKSFSQLDVYNNQYTSMSTPVEGEEYTLDVLFNSLSYEAMIPVQEYILLDSIIEVKYWNQKNLGQSDTISIAMEQTVTLSAYDNHPNTQYQWYKNNQILEEETNNQLELNISENSDAGNYNCRMTNDIFPELQLRSSNTTIEVDISTHSEDIIFKNLNISPNPTSESLIIEGLESRNYQYTITTTHGNVISSNQNLSSIINVSDLEPGVYILNIRTDGFSIARKFIKI